MLNFVLYREKLIENGWPGGIVDATLNRSIGLGQYADVQFWLIDCDDELFTYATRKLLRHRVNVKRATLRTLQLHITPGSWVITYPWLGKIYALMKVLKNVRWLLTIDVVPLYVRLFSKSFVDRILVNSLAFKALTYRWRKHTAKAELIVAVSDREAEVLEHVYRIKVNAIIPDPISVELNNLPKRNSLFLVNVKSRDAEAVQKIINAFRPERIVINNSTNRSLLPQTSSLDIQILEAPLPHEEFINLMATSDLVVLGDRVGSFEMMPLEAIAVGTPVVTPIVPSIEMFQKFSKEYNMDGMPFLDLDQVCSLNESELHKWFSAAQCAICDSREIIEKHFSVKSVGHQLYQLIKERA
ncbi:hypothetical protein B9Q03_13130 [Candidatus Marsarchaeota G2 archaeon OSP_D]|jgi:Glycosyltransferase|uniref:Glycosyl transferase family 1 domain-containing protein n=1 Tax=Candidatus Marsarchaeota G2 archaeon OSP_D TaxID=1978157 RepID=A0A2R6ADA6_9ARCH|nr:MAG: hypothetical protein B9Q03_13130 [Candidatus Marsarchaeota G2 archaeon OSP_D]